LRNEFSLLRQRRVVLVAALAVAMLPIAAQPATAENLFDMLFGGLQPKQHQRATASQPNFFADPFGLNQQAAPAPRPVSTGGGPAFCVRSCDGKYFPLTTRGGATAAQMCQAFCPASATRVYYGSNIDGATASNGDRYADSDNAFAYRKALNPDCTCNGRTPMGLAPVDLTLDTSLRSGDVVATADGLVAYSGIRLGASQTAEFTPVNAYPGLNAEVRTRLGEMKVAPVNADMVDPSPLPNSIVTPVGLRGKRAEVR
jgi:hypothetical protein